jgi:hypothetical protein
MPSRPFHGGVIQVKASAPGPRALRKLVGDRPAGAAIARRRAGA